MTEHEETAFWARARRGYLRRRPTLWQRLRHWAHLARAWLRDATGYGTQLRLMRWPCPACRREVVTAREVSFGFGPAVWHTCAEGGATWVAWDPHAWATRVPRNAWGDVVGRVPEDTR